MTRILVPMIGRSNVDALCLRAASDLAKSADALVDARLFHRNPSDVVPFVGEGVSPAAIEQIQKATQAQLKEQSQIAKEDFQQWCKKSGVSTGKSAKAGKTVANFSVIVGRPEVTIVDQARTSDITVIAAGDGDQEILAEAVLLDALRPLLLLPSKFSKIIGRNVVVAWNGSAEAARAVSMSYGILKRARKVTVVTVGKDADPNDLAIMLKSNGIAAQAVRATGGKGGASKALQREADKLSADLMVVGAYSHNRMREFLLGGVTRDLFQAPPLPVLMVH